MTQPWKAAIMAEDIKTLIKLLKIENREDLVELLKNCHTVIRSTGAYGSVWNSYISTFVFFYPTEDHVKIKNLKEEDKEYLLTTIREIYPPEENGPDITDIAFRILRDNGSNEIIEEENNGGIMVKKTIRIFLSYSSKDGDVAGRIKRHLENRFGFEVFLAHEDIEGGMEWENVIMENLKSTDFFMPLLSINFARSPFTDQETGMACVLGKRIIPIMIDPRSKPYGFIKKIQGIKYKEDSVKDWNSFEKKVITTISKDPLFSETIKEAIVKAFVQSASFASTQHIISILETIDSFSETQINAIVKGAIDNSQIKYEAYSAPEYMLEFVKKYKNSIEKDLLKMLLQTRLFQKEE